jgi:hypothetical protein
MSRMVSIPIALAIALLMSHELLVVIDMADQKAWMIPLALAATYLLYQRRPLDLLMVGAATLLAIPQAASEERLGVSPEFFLALALALLLLPLTMSAMGLDYSGKVNRTL